MKIQIVYCTVWHYTPRAVGLADELLTNFEPEIESVALIPSNGGRYEISVNGQLIYSKLQTGRHPEAGEVIGLVQKLSRKNKWSILSLH